MKIAIIGGGGAGLGAAWRLHKSCEITLYEACDRLGGHAFTADFPCSDGSTDPVDLGFFIFNRGYRNLIPAFRRLKVPTQPTVMTCSADLGDGIQWATNGYRTPYWRGIEPELERFLAECEHVDNGPPLNVPAGEYLRERGFSPEFIQNCLTPMTSCLFITKGGQMGLPIDVLTFNLSAAVINGQDFWRTIKGGSREYVNRISKGFADRVRLSTPIDAIERTGRGVVVRTNAGAEERHDALILAVPANHALRILSDATEDEKSFLGSARYESARFVLHRDPRLMPADRSLWSSFNYIAEGGSPFGARFYSYCMNIFQDWIREDAFVTVDPPPGVLRDEDIFARTQWSHVIYDTAFRHNIETLLPRIQGTRRTWYCGSYTGVPSHEQAFSTGLYAAEEILRLGEGAKRRRS